MVMCGLHEQAQRMIMKKKDEVGELICVLQSHYYHLPAYLVVPIYHRCQKSEMRNRIHQKELQVQSDHASYQKRTSGVCVCVCVFRLCTP